MSKEEQKAINEKEALRLSKVRALTLNYLKQLKTLRFNEDDLEELRTTLEVKTGNSYDLREEKLSTKGEDAKKTITNLGAMGFIPTERVVNLTPVEREEIQQLVFSLTVEGCPLPLAKKITEKLSQVTQETYLLEVTGGEAKDTNKDITPISILKHLGLSKYIDRKVISLVMEASFSNSVQVDEERIILTAGTEGNAVDLGFLFLDIPVIMVTSHQNKPVVTIEL